MRVAAVLLACWAASAVAQTRAIPATDLRSGLSFGSAELRAMQADDFANPGMLWVERGEKLWQTPAGTAGRTCASCHVDPATSMKGVAARYPALDAKAGRVIDLEGRINACRTSRQQAPSLAAESEDLLALTAFIAYHSRGLPLSVAIGEGARTTFEQGRDLYYVRHGQMNLSCADCHERTGGAAYSPRRSAKAIPMPTRRIASNGRLSARWGAEYGHACSAFAPRCCPTMIRGSPRSSSS